MMARQKYYQYFITTGRRQSFCRDIKLETLMIAVGSCHFYKAAVRNLTKLWQITTEKLYLLLM
ncbi:hypothetical protein ATC00_19690 [Sinorhizobium americanum]|nr:hypothetical protein ATC00_19690 [Sinorhizobium americanum]